MVSLGRHTSGSPSSFTSRSKSVVRRFFCGKRILFHQTILLQIVVYEGRKLLLIPN